MPVSRKYMAFLLIVFTCFISVNRRALAMMYPKTISFTNSDFAIFPQKES